MTAKTLGRFEIIREIGKGAMGLVYLAHDPKIDRDIAIKVVSIPQGVSPEEAREARHRFVREAQAAGKLAHPNIITIFDVVEEKDLSYIAMEYIEGQTLEAHTRPASLLPLNRVLPILAQACAALDYAHQHQVIHRDIKPANLMIMKDDLLKITDFGLAKSPQANLTQAGVLIGTPNYMSPEQISGRIMDGRSDFFSLGVVLYELLTGERPFSGDTISTIIYRILYEDPRPPRILNNKLPPAFDGIIKKALAKEPADRFQTGAEFVDALNNYSTYHLRSPVTSAPPTLRVGREAARARPALERTRPIVRPVSRPREPMFSGQPFKIAAVALFCVLAVLFFPRRTQDLGKGEAVQRAAAVPSKDVEAGFSPPALGLQPSITTHPGEGKTRPPGPLSGNQTNVLIPLGAKLFLDGSERSDTRVDFKDGDMAEHTLRAVNGCQEASILIRGSSLPATIDMRELKPRVGDLAVDSKPEGAFVYMDGKLIDRKTPVPIPGYNACEEHTFVLKKEDYKDFQRHFDGSMTWSEIAGILGNVTLSEIPPGFLVFDAMPSYPIDVYDGSRQIAVKDGKISLGEGEHVLTLKSPKVFFSRSLKVQIEGAKTLSVKGEWPGLGSLTVQAEPSNCKIYVDGQFLDYPPINGHEIVAGEHQIRAVLDIDPGQAQQKTVTIQAGSSLVETFTFNR